MKGLSFLIFTFSIICFSLSCDRDSSNPVGPATSDEYGSVVVRTVNEHENPFEGFFVTIHYETGEYRQNRTSADGTVCFDGITPGKYEIMSGTPYPNENNLPRIFHHLYDITVSGGDTLLQSFYFPLGPVDIPVNVELYSDVTPQYENIEIYFPDWDRTISLDGSGNGILQDVVLAGELMSHLDVIFSRYGMSIDEWAYLETDSAGWPYFYIYSRHSPFMEILTPQNNVMLNNNCVLLTGDGFDFEDGELPDNAFKWSSDIDGDLGTGREITPVLSVGKHKITLTVEDSMGSTSSTKIFIYVSHFSEQSYFPLPHEGVWKYRHNAPDIITTTEMGETERWTLEDMTVTSHDLTSRTCLLNWNVDRDGESFTYQYTLTDHISVAGNHMLVTATDEQLSVYSGDDITNELQIETIYTPSYPLLADYLDPQAGAREEVAVTAQSSLEYIVTGFGLHTREDTETITVSYETGSPENITTSVGTFATIPLASIYNDVERMWWLSRGIGIVKMEYDLFGETVTASLYETNMGDFSAGAGKLAALGGGSAPVRIQLDSSDDVARMRKIMDVMRGMCPR